MWWQWHPHPRYVFSTKPLRRHVFSLMRSVTTIIAFFAALQVWWAALASSALPCVRPAILTFFKSHFGGFPAPLDQQKDFCSKCFSSMWLFLSSFRTVKDFLVLGWLFFPRQLAVGMEKSPFLQEGWNEELSLFRLFEHVPNGSVSCLIGLRSIFSQSLIRKFSSSTSCNYNQIYQILYINMTRHINLYASSFQVHLVQCFPEIHWCQSVKCHRRTVPSWDSMSHTPLTWLGLFWC